MPKLVLIDTDECGFVPGSRGAEPRLSVAPEPGEQVFERKEAASGRACA
jgi:hypothetical protein